jgi:hypothetical protein
MVSPLKFLRSGPPPPKVVSLPDASFFTRVIPIAAGATPAEITAQVELALEAMAPFPLPQLFYGWYSLPGAETALVFAAYRRRFTTDQSVAWQDAELVVPAFASVLGAEVEPSTTIVLNSPESLTAVHWTTPGVPAKVLVRALLPEATEEERAAVRTELVSAMGGSKHVLDLPAPPEPDPGATDRELVFRSPEITARVPASVVASLDVRDKAELVALRSAHRRDLMLWRTMLACAAALVLVGLGELVLIGGKAWQSVRIAQLNGQKSRVEKTMNQQELAVRIDDLATKQLMPLEMLSEIDKPRPPEILFTRAVSDKNTTGLYTIVVSAQTTNPSQMSVYEAALRNLPSVQKVESTPQTSRGNLTVFQLTITFKPGALKPVTT